MNEEGYFLLVEDNPGDAGLTRLLLEEPGGFDAPAVRWVQTIKAAIQTLESTSDCLAVLLDLGLPDSEGLSGLHEIEPQAVDCPIVVLTGDDTETLGSAAVAAGAQDFLVKGSFDASQLRRCIRFATQRKRSARREIDRHRQAALAEAVAARDLLHSVLARVGDGFVALDLDWRYTYVNDQAVRMLGREKPQDLLGHNVFDVLPEIAGTDMGRACRQAMATQQPVVIEELYEPWNRWFENRLYPSPNGLTIYFSDTTERNRAQQELQAVQFELSQLAQRLLRQERDTTQRIAQALHDHLGQTLAVARLNLDACISSHAALMPPALQAQSARIASLLDQAVREVRQVLAELRPPLLEDQGLASALDNEIQTRTLTSGSADVLLEVSDPTDGCRWPDDVEYALFMVAREAITNALLHARSSLIRVVLDGDPRSVQLDVVDDGKGIPLPMVRGRPGHLGIVGMRERSIAIGARFSVTCEPEGGTRVTLRWEVLAP